MMFQEPAQNPMATRVSKRLTKCRIFVKHNNYNNEGEQYGIEIFTKWSSLFGIRYK